MQITIIGCGYVGLVTGVFFSDLGNKVCLFDIDDNKIDKLNNFKIPFYEPQLKEKYIKNFEEGNIVTNYDLESSVLGADIFFVCVGTPQKSNGKPNLKYLENVISSLINIIKKNSKKNHQSIFIKSTVPPGTINKLCKKYLADIKNVSISSNPEFLREGKAVFDAFNPDRVIVGSANKKDINIAKKLYSPVVENQKIFITSIESAEMIKYASNAFLATKISFINELSRLSDVVGADIVDVSKGMGFDKRIGNSFLNAGIGFGGSCFPKDLLGLKNSFYENGIKSPIIEAVLEINKTQFTYFLEKIYEVYDQNELKEKKVAIWGTAFKPDTDDIRESLGIKIVKTLSAKVSKVNAFDNFAIKNSELELKNYKNVSFFESMEAALLGSDFLIICTEDEAFKNIDFGLFQSLTDKNIFDGRNLFSESKFSRTNINYYCIGRNCEKISS